MKPGKTFVPDMLAAAATKGPTSEHVAYVRRDWRKKGVRSGFSSSSPIRFEPGAPPPHVIAAGAPPPHVIAAGVTQLTVLFWPKEGNPRERLEGARACDLPVGADHHIVRLGVLRANLTGIYPHYEVSVWERGVGVSGNGVEWVRRLPA